MIKYYKIYGSKGKEKYAKLFMKYLTKVLKKRNKVIYKVDFNGQYNQTLLFQIQVKDKKTMDVKFHGMKLLFLQRISTYQNRKTE